MEKFHSLSGSTIAEHNKQFNTFLHELKQQPKENIADFIKNLTTKNRQEENFRVKITIELGSTDDIIKILKEGDRISTKILLSNFNDYNRLFVNISGHDLTENICPFLSHVNKIRLLTKLSFSLNDEDKSEEYFNAVYRRYGIKIAKILLVACSDRTARENIKSNTIFNERELIRLHLKSDSFLVFYFGNVSKHHFRNCNILGKYLAKNDVKTCWVLMKRFGIPNIGKRGFLNILKIYKSEIIDEPRKYSIIFNATMLKKYLSRGEFRRLFVNLCRMPYFHFSNDIKNCLQVLPKSIRYHFFCDAYKQAFPHDLVNDYNNKWRLPLQLFPIAHQRIIIGNKYNIDSIKEKEINITNNYFKRSEILTEMLEACRLHDELHENLLDVLTYFLTRHKNDKADLRMNFLTQLMQKFNLQNLSQNHWDVLLDILKIFDVYGERYYKKKDYLAAYLLFKWQRGENYTEDFKKYIKTVAIYHDWFLNVAKFDEILLLRFPEFIEDIYEKQEDGICQFISSIHKFNCKYPQSTISFYKFPNYLKKYMRIENEIKSDLMANVIIFNPIEPEEIAIKVEIIDHYLRHCGKSVSEKVAAYLLKYEPEKFSKNIGGLNLSIYTKWFFYKITKMQFHPFYGDFRSFALNGLDDPKTRNGALKFLSYEKDFLELTQKFKPINLVIDIDQPDATEMVETQVVLIKSLRNISFNEKGVPVILHYCQNDYLRYSLETLYYAMLHSREISIASPITEISNRAVSVRKHAVFLTTTLGSTQLIRTTLTKMMEKEKNSSVRQFILKNTFRSLIEESSLDLYSLLKAQISVLKPDDDESIELLSGVKSIPNEYISDYLQEFWNYLKKCSDTDKKLILIKLLDEELINKIPENCCKETIRTKMNESDFNKLVCLYLFSQQSDLRRRQKFIFDCFVRNGSKIHRLIKCVCKILLRKPDLYLEFVAGFLDNFRRVDLADKFRSELLIRTVQSYLVGDESLRDLSGIFVRQQLDLVDEFGAEILKWHNDFVVEFFDMVSPILFSKHIGNIQLFYVELCEMLLSIKGDSDHVQLLVIKLLPAGHIKFSDLKQRRIDIVQKLLINSSEVVNIYLSKFLYLLGKN